MDWAQVCKSRHSTRAHLGHMRVCEYVLVGSCVQCLQSIHTECNLRDLMYLEYLCSEEQ